MLTTPGKRHIKNPLLGIFLTVFIDLLGFGMFIPDLQLRGRSLSIEMLGSGASVQRIAFITGMMLGVYSLAQLLTAPWLGRLSDRKGRRAILLFSSGLTVVSYLMYGFGTHVWMVILSRALNGIAAANLSVAFAYVADVTEPQERAKGMGLLGAAFGLGFILGPPAGALILHLSGNNPAWLGIVGAAISTINFAYIAVLLPESLTAPKVSEGHLVHDFLLAFRSPALAILLLMFFAVNIGFTNLETTYFQLLADRNWIFKLGEHARSSGAIILTAVGVVGAIMQGVVVRIVTPKWGEVRMLRFGLLLMAPVLAMVPFFPLWIPALLTVVLLGISNGLAGPAINSLVSRNAPSSVQGGIFGITQSLGGLARVIGPLISNPLFAWRPYAPYLLGGGIILVPALLAWTLKPPPESAAAGDAVVV